MQFPRPPRKQEQCGGVGLTVEGTLGAPLPRIQFCCQAVGILGQGRISEDDDMSPKLVLTPLSQSVVGACRALTLPAREE